MKFSTIRHTIQFLFFTLTIIGVYSGLSWVSLIGLVLLAGPLFCGWICPFGFLQDIMMRGRQLLGIKSINIPFHHHLKYVRYILYVLLLANIGNVIFNILVYDPRVSFQQLLRQNTLTIITGSVLFIFTMLSLFVDRFFCKYLCVEGAKHSLLSAGRILKVQRSNHCIQCKRCDRACPMSIEITKTPSVHALECISCLTCIDNCPVKEAIYVKPILSFRRIMWSLILIIILIISPQFIGPLLDTPSVQANNFSEASTFDEDGHLLTANGIVLLEGSAQGFKSEITVQVQKNGDKIENIIVVSHSDDMPWYNQSTRVLSTMIEKQSTDVDAVSGATYTSQGIINATKNALGQEYIALPSSEKKGRRHH